MTLLRRSTRADEDLIEIWRHIAESNPDAADKVLDEIQSRWRQLVTYPFSGRARSDIAPGIRQLVIGQYLTLYRLDGKAVRIVRVLHGRREIGSTDLSPPF